MKICFVITGGNIESPEFLRSKFKESAPFSIICADGGADHAYAAGLLPDIIIGDMDSLSSEKQNYFRKTGSKFIVHPETKDETDTQLALDYAFDLKPDRIFVFGACGTRIDHTLANISLLICGIKRNIHVRFVDELYEVFAVDDCYTIEGLVGQTVSILPLTEEALGVSLEGFEYNIKNAIMTYGVPYGISNKLISTKGSIEIRSGVLLIIRFFKPGIFP